MKAGIVTINDYGNYGNRLQNLALERILEKYGIEVETVRIYRNLHEIAIRNSLSKEKLSYLTPVKVINKFVQIYTSKKYRKQYLKREELFHKFSSLYLHETCYEIGQTVQFEDVIKEFDCFIVGSDQVWNPNYDDGRHLFFMPEIEAKKIAFAASFGITFSEKKINNEYIDFMKDFSAISVREEYAVEYLKHYGIDCTCIADPTIILGVDRWEKLLVNQEKIKENYIFVYFLGNMTVSARKHLRRIAKKNDLRILDIMNPESETFSNTDPLKFIQLIKEASLVYTDSFHACVFSILFKIPFIVCDRNTSSQKLSSRIDTLLKYFNMKERKFENINWENVFEMNFEETVFIISSLQKQADDFIRLSILEGEE